MLGRPRPFIEVLVAGGLSVGLGLAQEPQQTQHTLPGLPGVTVTAELPSTDPASIQKCQELEGYAKLRETFSIERGCAP